MLTNFERHFFSDEPLDIADFSFLTANDVAVQVVNLKLIRIGILEIAMRMTYSFRLACATMTLLKGLTHKRTKRKTIDLEEFILVTILGIQLQFADIPTS